MTHEIDPQRSFQFWAYNVSHGTALLRSPKGGDEVTNADIMFFGVEYVALPRHLGPIQLGQATSDEYASLRRLMGRDVDKERVFAVLSGENRHLVVAARVVLQENSMDMFESPFERP